MSEPQTPIYMDHHATTPVDPAVLEAYQEARYVDCLKTQKAAQTSLEWFENSRRYVRQHPLQFTDLVRGEADPGCVVHGFQHVIEQLAQTIVDGFDGLGLGLERRVRRDQDVQNCHGRDFLRQN